MGFVATFASRMGSDVDNGTKTGKSNLKFVAKKEFRICVIPSKRVKGESS